MPTLLSLFDGSGGFPLAGTLCGIKPIAASEIEPYPIAVTKSRFPNMEHLGEISKINGADIEPVDIVSFGSPCQDLSVAGLRKGLKHEENGDDETTRSGLFMEAVRIIKEMREKTNGKYPRFAVWENVPGAFSSNKGEDFRIVLEEIIKIVEPNAVMPEVPQKGWAYADSYCGDGWSVAYRVFDAQYWGVPQRRRRIYLVADFGGQCAREILFEREGLRGYFTQGRTPWKTAPADAQGSLGADDREGTDKSHVIDGDTLWVIDRESFSSGIGFDRTPGIILGGPHPTLGTSGPGAIAYEIGKKNYVDVELEVAVRKYEVDTERLSECLRSHKGKFTNKEIAEALNKPLTLVEHWFRQDTYFAIPDPDIWFDLKKLLGIETTEFDKAIMEFVYDGGNYDMRNRIYIGSTSPTLTCESGNALYLLPQDQIFAIENHPNDSRVKIDKSGKVQSLTGRMGTGGGNVPMIMEATVVLEGNGQRPSHQGNGYAVSDKSYTLNATEVHGVVYEQPIAVDRAFFNQGKNALYDPQIYEDGTNPTLVAKGPSAVCYWDGSQICGTLTANNAAGNQRMPDKENFNCVVEYKPRYIVRRLTPTECARLQGFADRWGDIDTKTELTDEEYRFWLDVRNTHAAINGRQTKEYTKAQMLTWYNKLLTDSAEYKMWGNGIALPTALYVMQGIEDALRCNDNGKGR